MLIDKDNLVRYKGNVQIPLIGGETVSGYAEIAMAKKEGVVFISYFKKDSGINKLDKFIVGAMNENGELIEKKEFTEQTEKVFFDAVKHFEDLIEQRQPPQEKSEPSVGKFYFFKKVLNKDSYVEIPGVENIIIESKDITSVFSPPQSKPYGRLNLLDIQNDNYLPIRGKYALKYLEKETKDYAQQNNISDNDFAIYDMIPYEINESEEPQSQQEQDEDINQINISDIEDEELKPKKQKEDNKSQKEKNKKDTGKDDDEEGEDDEGEDEDEDDNGGGGGGGKDDDDEGEDEDDDGDKEVDDGDKKRKKKEQKKRKGKPSDDDNDEDSEDDDGDKDEDNKGGKNLQDDLKTFFQTNDLKKSFKKQNMMISLIKTYDLDELKTSNLGKYIKTNDLNDFINEVKEQTKNNF